MIEKMTKYSWILLNSDKDSFLENLRGLGIVDIKRSLKPVDGQSEKMLVSIEALRKRISEIEKGSDDNLVSMLTKKHDLEKEADAVRIWGDFDGSKLAELGLELHFYSCASKKYDPQWPEQYPLQVVAEEKDTTWFVVVGDNSGFRLKEAASPRALILK